MDPRDEIEKYFAANEDAVKKAEARERRRAALENDKRTYELKVRQAKEKAAWFAANPGKTTTDYIRYQMQKFYAQFPKEQA